jgi:6-phosphogluconate dehydrogenase
MAKPYPIQSDLGLIGLDPIGRNVALRLTEHHINVAACHGGEKTPALLEQALPRVCLAANVAELLANLRQPRTIMVFSGAEAPMDKVMDQLLPELKREDLVMAAGDSYFGDTAVHGRRLDDQSIQFMGLALSGGEREARHGAIVMAGGPREACERTRPWLETLAVTICGEPCVSYFESAPAAHFVKMVHSGVECALLQLLSEIFGVVQRTLRLTDAELHGAQGPWLLGVLKMYVMEISENLFDLSPHPLLENKLMAARNKALGTWFAQMADELETSIPTIEAAVRTRRAVSIDRRPALLAAPSRWPMGRFGDDPENMLRELHRAFHAAMIITYAQGMALLNAASKHLGFHFNLSKISRAWRGGTDLRIKLLEDIATALETTPDLPGLLSDDDFSEQVMSCQEDLRRFVWRAIEHNLAAPALLASLDYLDCNKAAWLPANLIPPSPIGWCHWRNLGRPFRECGRLSRD